MQYHRWWWECSCTQGKCKYCKNTGALVNKSTLNDVTSFPFLFPPSPFLFLRITHFLGPWCTGRCSLPKRRVFKDPFRSNFGSNCLKLPSFWGICNNLKLWKTTFWLFKDALPHMILDLYFPFLNISVTILGTWITSLKMPCEVGKYYNSILDRRN